jgi:hypothetical protein
MMMFGITYLAMVWGLGSREVDEVAGPVRRRLRRQ